MQNRSLEAQIRKKPSEWHPDIAQLISTPMGLHTLQSKIAKLLGRKQLNGTQKLLVRKDWELANPDRAARVNIERAKMDKQPVDLSNIEKVSDLLPKKVGENCSGGSLQDKISAQNLQGNPKLQPKQVSNLPEKINSQETHGQVKMHHKFGMDVHQKWIASQLRNCQSTTQKRQEEMAPVSLPKEPAKRRSYAMHGEVPHAKNSAVAAKKPKLDINHTKIGPSTSSRQKNTQMSPSPVGNNFPDDGHEESQKRPKSTDMPKPKHELTPEILKMIKRSRQKPNDRLLAQIADILKLKTVSKGKNRLLPKNLKKRVLTVWSESLTTSVIPRKYDLTPETVDLIKNYPQTPDQDLFGKIAGILKIETGELNSSLRRRVVRKWQNSHLIKQFSPNSSLQKNNNNNLDLTGSQIGTTSGPIFDPNRPPLLQNDALQRVTSTIVPSVPVFDPNTPPPLTNTLQQATLNMVPPSAPNFAALESCSNNNGPSTLNPFQVANVCAADQQFNSGSLFGGPPEQYYAPQNYGNLSSTSSTQYFGYFQEDLMGKPETTAEVLDSFEASTSTPNVTSNSPSLLPEVGTSTSSSNNIVLDRVKNLLAKHGTNPEKLSPLENKEIQLIQQELLSLISKRDSESSGWENLGQKLSKNRCLEAEITPKTGAQGKKVIL